MNPYAVLAAAAARWERIAGLLGPVPLERLAGLLREARRDGGPAATGDRAEETGERRHAAALDAAELLAAGLPGLFGPDPQGRFTPAVPRPGEGAWSAIHQGYSADDLAVLLLDGHRMVGPLLGPVRRRLLAAPAMDPDTLRRAGTDPDTPVLIRLTGAGGAVRLPSFQFTAAARPQPIVTGVNAVLAADRDPWGAADWWLSANAWLGGRPEALVGTADEARLLDTARFLMEQE
ncbi:hypothetical protein [Streptomyces nitrosporeus]|uniref:Uncharacterized protein n=1 Tax=Streptomyces nitrosporeus TaxID=28894 RepID=A0A5J6F8M4_9ACTN|nr:hypothetical protein [Streptomyces nitrosporeus]QEU72602.1 hypothetical protein CP967_11900 [Streptomyces nitrosporeus]GGY76571.1 hypothetical protein GCM10010327_03230 [Streptomyces nitrosporeus]